MKESSCQGWYHRRARAAERRDNQAWVYKDRVDDRKRGGWEKQREWLARDSSGEAADMERLAGAVYQACIG